MESHAQYSVLFRVDRCAGFYHRTYACHACQQKEYEIYRLFPYVVFLSRCYADDSDCEYLAFYLYARTGMFDQLLTGIGLKSLGVLSDKKTVLPAMAFMYVWREAGYLMIFFLSGLQNLDKELYEAAILDGSPAFYTFRKITLPLLAPTTLFVTITALTDSLKLVDHVVIMTEGAPNNASTLLLYYIYQQGFIFFDQAKASALTVIMLVIMLIISMGQFVNSDKRIYYN